MPDFIIRKAAVAVSITLGAYKDRIIFAADFGTADSQILLMFEESALK